MMTTDHLHGHTTVTVDEQSNLATGVGKFLKNNKATIGVVLVGIAVVLSNRAILRKELRSINFSAEFWPDDFIDPEFAADFMD